MKHQTKAIRNFDLTTKQGKLFKALVLDGEVLSESQIQKRFSIANPTATISVIRNRGYAVYAKARKAGKGVNPFTGEEMMIKARPATKKPRWSFPRSLKETFANKKFW